MKRAVCVVLLLLTVNMSLPLASPLKPDAAGDAERLAEFAQALDSLRQRYKIPGLSAAIVHNQRIVWDRGYGFQDIAGGVPATPDTPYRIASLTKTFASMLLMRCVEQNKLDLNDLIINYTSNITQSGVRVRHVFTHTSESVPPGEKYVYNGNRFAALTPVVDACAGKPFREALAKTILDPLEMRDSVPGHDMENPSPAVAALFTPETLQRYLRVIQRLAKPYAVDGSGRIVLSTYPNRGISASAGLISTVRDLARYDAAIDRHLLLRPETQEAAWTNAVNSRGQVLPYGNGWFVQNRFGTRLLWHYGYWPTFSSLILKVPSRNITLILLANSDGLSAPFSSALGGAGDVTGSPFANLFLQMLDDPEAFRSNPIEEEGFFVRQHYRDFLGREPDEAGLDFWTNQITECGFDAQCREVRRINVSAAFFLSPEFQETGFLVYRAHQAAFNTGERLGMSAFLADAQAVAREVVVGRVGWQQQLEQNKQDYFRGFASRPEFLTAYPQASSASQFIDALDANAGNSLSPAERADLVGRLDTGAIDRAQALRAVVEGANFQRREFNRAFVLMQYFGYLRRNPNAAPEPGLNFDGYNYWLAKLDQFNGDFIAAEMVKAFLDSAEYRQRFTP